MVKNIFLERSKKLIDVSFKEFNLYKKTHQEHYRMQAGEKAWNALAQLGAYYEEKMETHHKDMVRQMKRIPHHDQNELFSLVGVTEGMHAFFYHGYNYDPEIFYKDLEKVREFINKKLKEEGYSL